MYEEADFSWSDIQSEFHGLSVYKPTDILMRNPVRIELLQNAVGEGSPPELDVIEEQESTPSLPEGKIDDKE